MRTVNEADMTKLKSTCYDYGNAPKKSESASMRSIIL